MNRLKNLAKMIAEKAKEKTPSEEFAHMLEEAIIRLAAEENRTPSKTFKPSSLGGCLRKMYYQVVGVEEDAGIDSTASSVGITQSGKDRHERIQKAVSEMKRLGYPVQWIDVEEYLKKRPQQGTKVVSKQGMETKLYNEILNMSFLCDGLFTMDGVYFVLEIKTEVSFKSNKREAPEEEHITQAACYSATLGIDRIMYVYENRDLCTKKVFMHIVNDDDKFNLVIAPIETVNTHIETGTVPPMTDKKKLCKYCDYKTRCKRDDVNGTAELY